MGFVLKKSNTYKWPVSVDVPVDGGKHERVTFDVEFRDLTQSRLLEIAELSGEGNLSDVEIAREVMSGWAGVEDEDGKELPYSITKRDELLDVPMMASDCWRLSGKQAGSQEKKLEEAVDYLFSGPDDKSELMADAKAFGLALPEPDAPEDFEVWPDNWPAVEMFLRCQTQWRTTASGVCGLDYSAVEWLFRLYEVEDQPTVLENLQVMEAAAVKILNKESNANGSQVSDVNRRQNQRAKTTSSASATPCRVCRAKPKTWLRLAWFKQTTHCVSWYWWWCCSSEKHIWHRCRA